MEFVCFVWISEKTANFALQNIKRSVFITEVESVYCAICTESLYNTDTFRLLKVNTVFYFLDRAFSIMKTKINQQNAQINSE